MNGHPEPPPEGTLIEAARRDAKLSVREAARRAGISEGWWRQVARGYQSLSGGDYGLVREVPAATIARMAGATGRVTPEQLETEGQRPDAAQALREMQAHASVPPPAPGVPLSPPPPGEPFTRENLAVITPVASTILRRLDQVRRDGIRAPSGWQMFPDNGEMAVGWDAMRAAGFEAEQGVWFLAVAVVEREQERREEARHRSGTSGA